MPTILSILAAARLAFGAGAAGLKLAGRLLSWLHGPTAHTVLHWLSPGDILKILATLLFYGSGLFGLAAFVGTESAQAFAALATALLAASQSLNRLLAGPPAAAATGAPATLNALLLPCGVNPPPPGD